MFKSCRDLAGLLDELSLGIPDPGVGVAVVLGRNRDLGDFGGFILGLLLGLLLGFEVILMGRRGRLFLGDLDLFHEDLEVPEFGAAQELVGFHHLGGGGGELHVDLGPAAAGLAEGHFPARDLVELLAVFRKGEDDVAGLGGGLGGVVGVGVHLVFLRVDVVVKFSLGISRGKVN